MASSAIHPWVAEGADRVRFATAGGPMTSWPDVVSFVRSAESLGFDACWLNDHPVRAMDCWPVLAALAVSTTRIRLLSLVSCVLYRTPAQHARLAADVDRLSDGRLVLGLGIGDDANEFEALGIPYPSVPERQARLVETLDTMRHLWDGVLTPEPVQQPHVPVLIAGGGERVTLRQVARYADMANFGPHEWTGGAFNLETVTRKLAVLRQHCEDEGRPYEAILRSHYSPLVVLARDRCSLQDKADQVRPNPREHFVPLIATPDEAIRHYQALADAGMQYFLANTRRADVETLELLAEFVLPAIQPAT